MIRPTTILEFSCFQECQVSIVLL